MTKQPVYLDHAAATPLDDDVFSVMQPYLAKQFYNPSALYLAAKDVHQAVANARQSVAKTLGARPSEIVFTAGGTEANNLAIAGVMERFPGTNVVVSAIEHDSVLEPAKTYACHVAPVTSRGRVDIDALLALVNAKTVLISVMYANNETGMIQPITTLAKHVQHIRSERQAQGNDTPLYLHTDACQAANYLTLTHARLGVDLMTVNGGKLYGPKQTGCLFVKTGTSIAPQVLGGGQERGMRSGTENVPGIVGFAQALQAASQRREAEAQRLGQLQLAFVTGLLERFPDAIVTGSLHENLSPNQPRPKPAAVVDSLQPVLPNFVHVRIPGADNERLIMELDERAVMAAAGSACSASSDEPSHVLRAMGLSEPDAQSSIRFTMGRLTTESSVDRVLQALADIDRARYTANS